MVEELFLYHATSRDNVPSILKNGLLANPPSHAYASFGEAYLSGKVFLALDSLAAEAYGECADDEPEDVVVFKIPLVSLDERFFNYDWNNRCEYSKEINSCTYEGNIPAELLAECDPNREPGQSIHDFEGTYLYEKIMDVFDFEVEANKEEENKWY